MMPEKPDLNSAYALETPDDSRRLYALWAHTYDQDFAADTAYELPRHVAGVLRQLGPFGPVLDVGAGTGLVAAALGMGDAVDVHALDISADMLAVAQGKGLYTHTIEADLTDALPLEDGVYGSVVSAGTFTHGHVGPQALDELIRVAQADAWFVLAINSKH